MSLNKNKEDPRVRRTHRLLVESFGKLLSIKNYESISITDITKEADVNRATFYAHFSDKDELFEEIIYESFQKVLDPSLTDNNDINESIIRKIILSSYEYLTQMEGICSQYNDATKLLVEHKMKVTLSEFVFQRLKHNCRDNIGENVLKVNAAMIGNAICGAACMGQSAGIDVLTDEICHMVLPKIYSLTM